MPPETQSIRIRLAVAEDAPAISSVLHQAFIEYKSLYTPDGFAATTPTTDQILNRLAEGPIWVVENNDMIVGTVSVVPNDLSMYIRGMAILPEARGHRIGELLLKKVESFAADCRVKRLFLSTTPFLDRAIRLYETNGFKRIGEGPDNLFGTPLFTMEKTVENIDV